jgi:hypothetical protein
MHVDKVQGRASRAGATLGMAAAAERMGRVRCADGICVAAAGRLEEAGAGQSIVFGTDGLWTEAFWAEGLWTEGLWTEGLWTTQVDCRRLSAFEICRRRAWPRERNVQLFTVKGTLPPRREGPRFKGEWKTRWSFEKAQRGVVNLDPDCTAPARELGCNDSVDAGRLLHKLTSNPSLEQAPTRLGTTRAPSQNRACNPSDTAEPVDEQCPGLGAISLQPMQLPPLSPW